MNPQDIAFKTYHGPNLIVHFAAVEARVNCENLFGPSASVTAAEVASLKPVLPDKVFEQLSKVSHYETMEEFILALAMSLQEIHSELGLESSIRDKGGESSDIYMGFVSEQGARAALRVATEIALLLKRRIKRDRKEVQPWLRQVLEQQRALQPRDSTAAMLRVARNAGIPQYAIHDTPRLFALGQGRLSQLYTGSLSTQDSHIGQGLQRNKLLTNQMLKSMGYPCTTQYPAYDLGTLRHHVDSIGFPVVVKPSSESKGNGITADIRDEADLERAFTLASKYSNGEVLVERFVSGDDHRITLSDGIILNAARKSPPAVEGDGRRSIRELIQEENRTRLEAKRWFGAIKDISIDEPLHLFLRYNNMTVDSVPAAGQRVVLRASANLATGGTLSTVLDEMHPDNAEMVLSIARVFRLNTMGVDFITPDISRSWRECGEIIEVNAFPALNDRLAETMLREQFEANNFGRIPSALILTDKPETSTGKLGEKLYEDRVAAYVDSTKTTARLGTVERKFEAGSLYKRCAGLLIDPDCEAIVVVATVEEIASNGLPLAHFDNVYVETNGTPPENLAPEIRVGGEIHELLQRHAGRFAYI